MICGGGGKPGLKSRASNWWSSPHEWEFALEECGLSCGGLFACAAYGFSLPASEGNFVNEVFAAGGAAGFPGDEDALGDKPPDGGGGVAQEGGCLLYSNPSRAFELLPDCFHKGYCNMLF